MKKNIINNGFTLVELIIIIVIITILTIIAYINIQWYTENSRDGVRISDISKMKMWLELFQIDNWNYPTPSEWEEITYSWAKIWTQWYFWESVKVNTDNLNKVPIDPLTNLMYVYSLLDSKLEYQIAWIMEWENIVFSKFKNKVLANKKTARLKISWTYNWRLLKVKSSSISYILAIPSIVTSSGTDLQKIIDNNSLAYNWYKNLPSQYDWVLKTVWEDNLKLVNKENINVFSWDINLLSSSMKYWEEARKSLMNNLKEAYIWTAIESEPQISKIVSINSADKKNREIIATNIVSDNLWWNVVINPGLLKNDYCSEWNKEWYIYWDLEPGETSNVTKSWSIDNWNYVKNAIAICKESKINILNEITNISCNFWYVENDWECILDECSGEIPLNSYSTASIQDNNSSWSYNSIPWICTFNCNDWYIWNNSTEICDSQWSWDSTTWFRFKNIDWIYQYPSNCNELYNNTIYQVWTNSPWNWYSFESWVYYIQDTIWQEKLTYCDMWYNWWRTLAIRLNTNDSTTRKRDNSAWTTSSEIWTLSWNNDYFSSAFYELPFKEIYLKYVYSWNQVLWVIYKRIDNTKTLKQNVNLARSNSNPQWTKIESIWNYEFFWNILIFQPSLDGNDFGRIWYNYKSLWFCNQWWTIWHIWDKSASRRWYWEVARWTSLNWSYNCQHNGLKVWIWSNYAPWNHWSVRPQNFNPTDIYYNWIMYIYIK